MNKKILKILGAILLLIIVLGLAFLLWVNHAINTGKLVKWEGEWYYEEELKEKYPPQEYSVEAKNKPEEVYQEFRQALLDGDKEKALGYIVEEKREEYRKAFKDEGKFDGWLDSLPENIIKEREDENYLYYDLKMGTNYKNTLIFLKNKEGYWKIESI